MVHLPDKFKVLLTLLQDWSCEWISADIGVILVVKKRVKWYCATMIFYYDTLEDENRTIQSWIRFCKSVKGVRCFCPSTVQNWHCLRSIVITECVYFSGENLISPMEDSATDGPKKDQVIKDGTSWEAEACGLVYRGGDCCFSTCTFSSDHYHCQGCGISTPDVSSSFSISFCISCSINQSQIFVFLFCPRYHKLWHT